MMIKTILITLFCFTSTAYASATGEVLKDTAKGAVVGGAIGAVQTEVGKQIIGEKMSSQIGNFFESPAGIATMAGISTIYSTTLYNAAAEQEEESKRNIAKIDKIIQSYKDSWSGFCPNGREKLEEPLCYCYLDNGKTNPNRTNSKICQDLWKKNALTLTTLGQSYLGLDQIKDPVGCVTVTNQFDENCRCKKLVDAKGNNACKKTASISIPNGIASAFVKSTGVKDVLNFAANSTSGNPNFNSLSPTGLALKAISGDNFNRAMLTKLSGNLNGTKNVELNEDNVLEFSKRLLGEKAIRQALANFPFKGSNTASASVSPGTNKILNDVKKKNSLELEGSGKGLGSKGDEKKSGLDLNFADSSGSGGGAIIETAPEKTYKYKDADISKDESASIFDIISNRYIQSGLRRLFDE
jgi:hypothetical protein